MKRLLRQRLLVGVLAAVLLVAALAIPAALTVLPVGEEEKPEEVANPWNPPELTCWTHWHKGGSYTYAGRTEYWYTPHQHCSRS